MFIYLLFTLSLGIEGGWNQPALGFKDLKSGTSLAILARRNFGITDISLSIQASFYNGDNPSYSLNGAGFRLGFSKSNWLFSPSFDFGGDIISRGLNKNKESGYALDYCLGFVINYRVKQLIIYPKFFYEGLTDLNEHAGFIGIKLGINYEI